MPESLSALDVLRRVELDIVARRDGVVVLVSDDGTGREEVIDTYREGEVATGPSRYVSIRGRECRNARLALIAGLQVAADFADGGLRQLFTHASPTVRDDHAFWAEVGAAARHHLAALGAEGA